MVVSESLIFKVLGKPVNIGKLLTVIETHQNLNKSITTKLILTIVVKEITFSYVNPENSHEIFLRISREIPASSVLNNLKAVDN